MVSVLGVVDEMRIVEVLGECKSRSRVTAPRCQT